MLLTFYECLTFKNITDHHDYRLIPAKQITAVSNLSSVAGAGLWQNPGC